MYIFYILHTASTDDVLLRNLAKVWMSKDELDNNWRANIQSGLTHKSGVKTGRVA